MLVIARCGLRIEKIRNEKHPCFWFPQGGVPRRGKLVPVKTRIRNRLVLSKVCPFDRLRASSEQGRRVEGFE